MSFILSITGLPRKCFTDQIQGQLFLASNKSGCHSRGQLQEKPSAVCLEEVVSDQNISFWFLNGKGGGGSARLCVMESKWMSAVAHNSAMPGRMAN